MANLPVLDFPAAPFMQASAITAAGDARVAEMLNRALVGAGRSAARNILTGRESRLREERFRDELDYRKSRDSREYGLREQAMRLTRARFSADFWDSRAQTAMLQQDLAQAHLDHLTGDLLMDESAPEVQAAQTRLETARNEAANARSNAEGAVTRGMDLVSSLNLAVEECPGGT